MTDFASTQPLVFITGTKTVGADQRLTRAVAGRAPVQITSTIDGLAQSHTISLPPQGLSANLADVSCREIWPNIGGAGADQVGSSSAEISWGIQSVDYTPDGLVIVIFMDVKFQHFAPATACTISEIDFLLSIDQPL